jgi:hypothetical protein
VSRRVMRIGVYCESMRPSRIDPSCDAISFTADEQHRFACDPNEPFGYAAKQ